MLRVWLYLMGLASILAGVLSIAYAGLSLGPRLANVSDQLQVGLASLAQATAALNDSLRELSYPRSGVQAAGKIADEIPATLIALKGSLSQAANALSAGGNTTRKVKNSIAGAVLPKGALQADTSFLKRAASELQLLSGMVDLMAGQAGEIAASAHRFSADLPKLRARFGTVSDALQGARDRIESLGQALQDANLPIQAMLLGLGFGGLYILLGSFSIALALAHRQASLAFARSREVAQGQIEPYRWRRSA
jgi:methyl-accepting chemotaxis protein